MTAKRFTLRVHPKDNGVKIFDDGADDGYRRLFDVHYVDYESAKLLRARLEPVVDLLNNLHEENKQLRKENKALKDANEGLIGTFVDISEAAEEIGRICNTYNAIDIDTLNDIIVINTTENIDIIFICFCCSPVILAV